MLDLCAVSSSQAFYAEWNIIPFRNIYEGLILNRTKEPHTKQKLISEHSRSFFKCMRGFATPNLTNSTIDISGNMRDSFIKEDFFGDERVTLSITLIIIRTEELQLCLLSY